jgi:hypothetical protein
MIFETLVLAICFYAAYRTWQASTSPTATAIIYAALLSLINSVLL